MPSPSLPRIAVPTRQPFSPRRSSSRARWSPSEAKRILDHAAASGMSLYAYAARHGLCSRQLYWWRARLSEAQPAPAPEPLQFVPVVALRQADASLDQASGVEVVVGAVTVRLARSFCAETLAQVVAVLGREATC